MRSYFPDVNVWIALTYRGHVHYPQATAWLDQVDAGSIFFCRFTQLGLLRVLTNSHVMGAEVCTQREAWRAYDRWFGDDRVAFLDEPPQVEAALRRLTQTSQALPAAWPDAYLAALSRAAGLTLVTLDKGFQRFEHLDLLLLESAS